jgi:adenosylmethionine-8-amino-7-oxononanoate aminotransferase
MCLAKGLSGGTLPLAATLTTEEIFSVFLGEFEEGKAFYHGHTYCGNPVACSAALASIGVFEREPVLAHVRERSAELENLLSGLTELPHVADIRQWGLMVGIELVHDVSARKAFPAKLRVGKKVILEARKRGVMLRPLGDVIILMPPLSTTREELRNLVSVVADSIRAATASVSH